MKNIIECIPNVATQINTVGAGNIDPLGSDPILVIKPIKKKMKSLKNYIHKKVKERDIKEEFNERYPNVYLMVGIPGSGKSTWCEKNHPDLPIVSRDLIRAELGYTKNADEKVVLSKQDESKVTKVEKERIQDLIQQCWDKKIKGFIIDDTNTGKYRKSLIDELHAQSCFVIGVNIDTPLETCIKRRKGQIPENVMRKLYQNKIDLKLNEVDKIITVK